MDNIDVALRDQILEMSRQAQIGPLNDAFASMLDMQIEQGRFLPEDKLRMVGDRIINDLRIYSHQTGVNTVVLGMSGGVDSALTAALFKEANWVVIGVTMPINQDPAETERGIEACKALDIEHVNKDLSFLYQHVLNELSGLVGYEQVDPMLVADDTGDALEDNRTRIRRGNIRARVRMITLYNLAAFHGGLVASTDNFSELTAGFWTLHGDVGDLAPIQSLLKSWEVPMLAKMYGVPEKTWRATPTDGLAILAGGDEAQLGCSYLEWDIAVNAIRGAVAGKASESTIMGFADVDPIFGRVIKRMKGSWFKRMNPVNLVHTFDDRFSDLEAMDKHLCRPDVARSLR